MFRDQASRTGRQTCASRNFSRKEPAISGRLPLSDEIRLAASIDDSRRAAQFYQQVIVESQEVHRLNEMLQLKIEQSGEQRQRLKTELLALAGEKDALLLELTRYFEGQLAQADKQLLGEKEENHRLIALAQQRQEHIEKLSSELNCMRKSKLLLEQQVRKLQSDVEALLKQNETQAQEKQLAETKLAAEVRARVQLERKKDYVEEEAAKARLSLSDKSAEADSLRNQLQAYRQREKELMTQRQQQSQILRAMRAEAERNSQLQSNLKGQVAVISESFTKATAELDIRNAELVQLLRKLDRSEIELERITGEAAGLRRMLEVATAEEKKLRSMNEGLSKESNRLLDKLTAGQECVREKDGKAALLEARLQTQEQLIDQLQRRKIELETDLAKYEEGLVSELFAVELSKYVQRFQAELKATQERHQEELRRIKKLFELQLMDERLCR